MLGAGGRGVGSAAAGVVTIDTLGLVFDKMAQSELRTTLERFDALGIKGVITSTYRPESYAQVTGGGYSDHTRGLAIDVSYGTHAQTVMAFNELIKATSKLETIRQLIFENVRGTQKGYHIHIGFWPSAKTGKIESLLWHSAIAYKLGGRKYNQITGPAGIPRREVFENA